VVEGQALGFINNCNPKLLALQTGEKSEFSDLALVWSQNFQFYSLFIHSRERKFWGYVLTVESQNRGEPELLAIFNNSEESKLLIFRLVRIHDNGQPALIPFKSSRENAPL
jgi:hypothetical protein